MAVIANHSGLIATIWLAIACVGCGFKTALLWRAVEDWYFTIRYKKNGLRRYKAMTNIWIFAGGVIFGAFNIAGASIAIDHRDTWTVTTIAEIFISYSVIALMIAVVINARRKILIEMLERRDNEPHQD